MDKTQINETLNQLFLEKRYSGNLRAFDSVAKKVFVYGPLAFILGAGVMYPFSAAMIMVYRTVTDKCKRSCGRNTQCYNKCYYINCKRVVELIKADIAKLNKIEDPEKRNRAEKSLRKELTVWEKRLKNYKEKVVSNSVDED